MEKKKMGVFLNSYEGKETITIRGPILGQKNEFYDEGDYIAPSSFKEALDQVKSDNLEVVINSQGGDVFASIEIYNMLKESGKKIKTIISGRAFSGGHIIAMAGEERLIYDNSQGLAHRASTVAWGNALDLLETVDWLEKIDENIMNIYGKVFNGTREELGTLLDKDKPINAEECLRMGFATGIIGTEEKEEERAMAFAQADIKALAEEVSKLLAENKTEEVKEEKKGLFDYFKEDK